MPPILGSHASALRTEAGRAEWRVMEILAIIPARSGSKSVPDKNIRMVGGKPMLVHSIEHARASKLITRVILSTDSRKYAEIGREAGAEVPFIRPAEYATDTATDLEVFEHALKWLKNNEGYEPDIVVQLRPTYPIRRVEDIDTMINMLCACPQADSVRSMSPATEIPYKMWAFEDDFLMKTGRNPEGDGFEGRDERIVPVTDSIKESYNMPRQALPVAYYQNACIDVMRSSTVLEKHSMTGDVILGYVMKDNYDIDSEAELLKADFMLGGKKFVFDIDGVIAKLQKDNDYALSEPDMEMIEIVNRLYDAGNTIVLHTARGSATGIDWTGITRDRLAEWKVKYHELHFGKPSADYYIDDKMLDYSLLRKMFR